MNDSQNPKPPYWALVFFRWFCHPEFREDIEGDLLERFHNRITGVGVPKAKWLFIMDVLMLFRPGIIKTWNHVTEKNYSNMKRMNLIKMTAINLLVIVMIVLPFLPGPPNKLVIGLSVFAQSLGFFGLLLVPIGIIWTLIEIQKLKNKNNKPFNWRPAYYFAITSIVLASAICLLLLFVAVVHNELFAALAGLIVLAFVVYRASREVKKLKNNSDRKFNLMPIYLVSIPLISLITVIIFVKPLSSYSRNFAIQRSQLLISSIEEYKYKEGKYPESIQELQAHYIKKIPSPFIMGIQKFRYNKIDEHYSLSFSQWLHFGSLEEIVLYDKNNLRNNLKGSYANYNYKFDLCRVNLAFASHDTRYDNWRYYLVD